MNSRHDTAELQSFRLTDLQKGLSRTRDQLLDVCANEGFFYLEIDDHESSFEEVMESQMNFAKRVFDVCDDEKRRYNFKTTGRPSTSGFKAARTETGAFGKADGFELYMLPYNELVIREYPRKLICPQVVACNQATIASWAAKYHGIGLSVLNQLSQALELTDNLTSAHDPLTPSTSSISLLKYMTSQREMDGGHVAHTDIGTLTLLYSLVDGLQIFHPIRERWLWVEPRRGSLVVNVGDSLSLLTSQRLKSCLHRVIPHPNAQSTNRYSIAYFMRPNEDVALDIGDGQRLSSMDWHFRKLKVFAAPLAVQKEQYDMLHGRF